MSLLPFQPNITKKNNFFSFLGILSKGRTLEKRLLRNHLLAVLLLVTMVSISFLILTSIIKTQHNNSSLINISGKQRMYTQRVLYYYDKYLRNQNENAKQQVYANLEKLNENNRYLTNKLHDRDSVSYYDRTLMRILDGQYGAINQFKKFKINIQEVLKSKDPILHDYIEIQGEKLIELYDKATLQYQKLAEDKVAQFLLIETTLFAVSLLTIFLEALLIFRPAILEVFNKHSQLRALNKNLSREVKKKVAQLREKEQLLIQQAKLAEMGEMLSNISHQWKQPLTILSMQIEDIELSLEHGNIDKKEMDITIENCYKQIDLMSSTIEDFKRFYMPDNEKKLFNVYALIEEIIQMEKSALHNYTIDHTIHCEDKSTTIMGYESQFKQVLFSLTNNAIEQIRTKIYENQMDKSSGKILYKISVKESFIKISVEDNAQGIPDDIIKKVFKPYFSSKKDKGGSGIGLHIAKTIIEKNFKGKLNVKNKNDGACFSIIIPNL